MVLPFETIWTIVAFGQNPKKKSTLPSIIHLSTEDGVSDCILRDAYSSHCSTVEWTKKGFTGLYSDKKSCTAARTRSSRKQMHVHIKRLRVMGKTRWKRSIHAIACGNGIWFIRVKSSRRIKGCARARYASSAVSMSRENSLSDARSLSTVILRICGSWSTRANICSAFFFLIHIK